MARVQVGYDPRAEALQTTAAPNIQTVQARAADPNGSTAYQLAAALGAPSVQQGLAGLQDRLLEKNKEEQQKKALETFGSMPAEELGKAIKEGKILENQSPIYVAHLQNLYGANLESRLKDEGLMGLDNGTITPEGLDKWLNTRKNELLSGQSEYTIAGFNKSYAQNRDALLAAAARKSNDTAKVRANEESTDFFGSATDKAVQAYAEKGPQAIADLMKEYELQTKTGILSDPATKRKALVNIVNRMAATGNEKLVKEFLDTLTPNNGPRVSAILDAATPGTAESLLNSAKSYQSKAANDRIREELISWDAKIKSGDYKPEDFKKWAEDPKNKPYLSLGEIRSIENSYESRVAQIARDNQSAALLRNSEESVSRLQRGVELALSQGVFNAGAPFVGAKRLTPDGKEADFNATEYATKILIEQTANLPLDKRVMAWKSAGLVDPQLTKVIETGMGNLYSIGVQADGKKVGQLNPAGQAAIDQYNQIASFDIVYADKVAGSYKDDMRNIRLLMIGPNPQPAAEAVRIVNENKANNTSALLKREEARAKVATAMQEALTKGFFEKVLSPVETVSGMFKKTPPLYLDNVTGEAIETAALMYGAGQVPLETAIESAKKYVQSKYVVVNGTAYYQDHLPNVPQDPRNPMDQRIRWMDRLIREEGGKYAKQYNAEPSDLRLVYNKTSGTYTYMIGANPIIENGVAVTLTPPQINAWAESKHADDKAFEGWQAEARKTVTKGPEVIDRNRFPRLQQLALINRQAWEFAKEQKILDRPVVEQLRMFKDRRAKGN